VHHAVLWCAFNALLKTLEEPPPHAVFVLATTEAHKIPATIVSRCQRYDFRRVAIPEIIVAAGEASSKAETDPRDARRRCTPLRARPRAASAIRSRSSTS
jgi:DNA polymerase III delta prime subunit